MEEHLSVDTDLAQFPLTVTNAKIRNLAMGVLSATGLISLNFISNHENLTPGGFREKVWAVTPSVFRGSFSALLQPELFTALQEVFVFACSHARRKASALPARAGILKEPKLSGAPMKFPRLNALVLSNPSMKAEFLEKYVKLEPTPPVVKEEKARSAASGSSLIGAPLVGLDVQKKLDKRPYVPRGEFFFGVSDLATP